MNHMFFIFVNQFFNWRSKLLQLKVWNNLSNKSSLSLNFEWSRFNCMSVHIRCLCLRSCSDKHLFIVIISMYSLCRCLPANCYLGKFQRPTVYFWPKIFLQCASTKILHYKTFILMKVSSDIINYTHRIKKVG